MRKLTFLSQRIELSRIIPRILVLVTVSKFVSFSVRRVLKVVCTINMIGPEKVANLKLWRLQKSFFENFKSKQEKIKFFLFFFPFSRPKQVYHGDDMSYDQKMDFSWHIKILLKFGHFDIKNHNFWTKSDREVWFVAFWSSDFKLFENLIKISGGQVGGRPPPKMPFFIISMAVPLCNF